MFKESEWNGRDLFQSNLEMLAAQCHLKKIKK
jgi:hypothetical protein